MTSQDARKAELLNDLQATIDDCQEFVDREPDDFDDPWDVHDVHNWEAIIEIIENAAKYIKAH